ncbi:MAG: electron transport complex protein RnfC, partial [Motiliproteus sp.]
VAAASQGLRRMSRIWSFHGGVHPPENKRQSLKRPLERLPLPTRLILPLQQHIGAPSTPLVSVGDHVLKGQVIAEPAGHISVYLHAPTSGTITAIGSYPVPHPSSMDGPCIQIEPDGEDLWIEHQGVEDFRSLDPAQLTRIIRQAGIAGMGGAGFPTSVKLHLSDDHIVNTLIINGAECEPYITADDTLMRERAAAVIGGIEIAAHLIKPTHCLIGIEDNKPEAAMALTRAARNSSRDIEVVVVPTKYPSGGEKQLIQLLTGVEVPSGKLPAHIGIVVQNVGTMAAVYSAVKHGEPLISRITTLAGEALARPGNVEVLLGTPIQEVLAHAGVDPERMTRLVMGGPMMGYTLDSDQVPIIKTSNCVIAATAEEFPQAPPAQNCIRCGLCEQACPADLLPQQLFWFAKGKEFDKALSHNLMDCIECGACAYVCPSNIPLVQYYRFAKGEIRREQSDKNNAEQARIRFEARQQRLEQEKQDKADKRKARAAEAARAQATRKDASLTPAKPAAGDQAAPAPTLIELKIAAATIRTQVSKTEAALADARAKDLPGADKLQLALDALQVKSEQAQAALQQREQAGSQPAQPPAAAPATAAASQTPDIKQLKTAAAIARTRLKKTQKALTDAQTAGTDTAVLAQQVERLTLQSQAAEQAFTAAEASQPPAGPTLAGPTLAELKIAAARVRTQVSKTETALAVAQAKELPSADTLTAALATLKAKALTAEQALADAQSPAQSPLQPDAQTVD